MEEFNQWNQIYTTNDITTGFFPQHNSLLFETNDQQNVNPFNLFNPFQKEENKDNPFQQQKKQENKYQNMIQQQYQFSQISINLSSQVIDHPKKILNKQDDNISKNYDMLPKNLISKNIMNKYNKTSIPPLQLKKIDHTPSKSIKNKHRNMSNLFNPTNNKQAQSKFSFKLGQKKQKRQQTEVKKDDMPIKRKSVFDFGNFAPKNKIKSQEDKKSMIEKINDNKFQTESIQNLKKSRLQYFDDCSNLKKLYCSKVEIQPLKNNPKDNDEEISFKKIANNFPIRQSMKMDINIFSKKQKSSQNKLDIFKRKSNQKNQQLQSEQKNPLAFRENEKKEKIKVDFKHFPVIHPRQTISLVNDNNKYIISKDKNAPKIYEKLRDERDLRKTILPESSKFAISSKSETLIKNHNKQFEGLEGLVQNFMKQIQNLEIRMKQQNKYVSKISTQTEILKRKIDVMCALSL